MKQISYFRYVREPEKGNDVPISKAIEEIKSGRLATTINQIRQAAKAGDKEKKKQLKEALPVVTFNGTFSARRMSGLKEANGLVTIDIDDVTDDEVKMKESLLKDDPHAMVVFRSPSNKLKAVFNAETIRSEKDYNHAWECLRRYIRDRYGLEADAGAKDLARATFLSHDTTAYFNENAEPFKWTYLDDITTKAKNNVNGKYLCPFHDDKNTPNLHLYEDDSWFCFGCQRDGKPGTIIIEDGQAKKHPDARVKKLNGKGAEKFVLMPEGSYERCVDNIKAILASDKKAPLKKDEISEEIVFFIKTKEHIVSLIDDYVDEFWYYKNGIYVKNGKSIIDKWSRAVLGKSWSEKFSRHICDKIRTDCAMEKDDFFNETDIKKRYHLCVKNGILDLKNLTLRPHTPDEVHFTRVEVEYDLEATCPKFLEFLDEVVPDENDENLPKVQRQSKKVLQEYLGSCLVKDVLFEKALIIFGGKGRNGKGKMLEYFQTFLGDTNCKNLQFRVMASDSYSKSGLHGKLVNISGEMERDVIEDVEMLKDLTGRGPQDVQRKYKSNLQFRPYANLLFACNALPPVWKSDPAFWTRWLFVEFPYQFREPSEYDPNNPYHRRQDAERINRMIEAGREGEFSGFLNWLLEGLHRALSNNGFTTGMNDEEVKLFWHKNSSSIFRFLYEMCKADPEEEIPKINFRRNYQKYCQKRNLKMQGDKAIYAAVSDIFGASSMQKASGERVWFGLDWKDKSFDARSFNGSNIEVEEEDIA